MLSAKIKLKANAEPSSKPTVAAGARSRVMPLLGMGQVMLVEHPAQLVTILGSCIGVVLHQPKAKMGVVAHVVLPKANGREGEPGKFADTAIPFMLNLLACAGVTRQNLIARICGGSCMFGADKQGRGVGEQNALAVRAALENAGVPLVAEHLGGAKGRRVTFDPATGKLKIEIVGQEPIFI